MSRTTARLGGAGFYSGLDELLKRAAAVREAASPEYQHEVLTSLPTNPTAGPVLRLDDLMSEARIVDEPVRNDAIAGFENVFTYDFDEPGELASATGKLKPTVRDGVLVVEHVRDDYLQNARPIEIVTDDVGEIVVRAKATKGTHFSLAWSPKAKPELPWRYRVDIPLIADGKFHNYTINARNALRRGLDEGSELHFLALQPSNVPGDRVEVDFIRFLSTHSKYLRKPRDLAYETVAGEMRAGDVDAAAPDTRVHRSHPGPGSALELRHRGHGSAFAHPLRSAGRQRLEVDRAAQPDCRGARRLARRELRPAPVGRARCRSATQRRWRTWQRGTLEQPDRLRPSDAAAARNDRARRCIARRSPLRVRLP